MNREAILRPTTETTYATDHGTVVGVERDLVTGTEWHYVGAMYRATIRHQRGSRRWTVDAPIMDSAPIAFRTGKSAREYVSQYIDALH